MILSDQGRTLIKGFEGLSLKAYKDADGYSIGYGHFGAKAGDVITRAEADRLFDEDVSKFERAVSTVTPFATQPQFDAMVSLAYNIGTGGFSSSTVAKRHNAGDFVGAADAFRMWNKSQGAVHAGLVKRREQERAFYLGSAVTPPGSFPTEPPQQSNPNWPPPEPSATAPLTPPEYPAPGWGSASPSIPSSLPGAGKPAVITLAALAIGWLLYRLAH